MFIRVVDLSFAESAFYQTNPTLFKNSNSRGNSETSKPMPNLRESFAKNPLMWVISKFLILLLLEAFRRHQISFSLRLKSLWRLLLDFTCLFKREAVNYLRKSCHYKFLKGF